MKYFITLIILLLLLLISSVIINSEYNYIINVLLIILMFLNSFFWEYSILNKKFEYDFRIRSQRKIVGTLELLSAIAWTILQWLTNDNYEDLIFFILIFWTIPVSELIMFFIYKTEKPYTLFVKENQLILNKRWTQKRDLTELTEIRFNRISKNLNLDFKSKSEVSIKTTEYKTEDIQMLLDILIEKSEYNIYIPKNYQLK